MKKIILVWTLFGLAFVVNPNLACSSSDPEYDYGESEMKAAIVGEWQGTAKLALTPVAFTLSLEQATAGARTQSISAPPIRPQCSSRSFVKPAGACADITTMPLVGTISSEEEPLLNGDVTGMLEAGLKLDNAGLSLELPNGITLSGLLQEQVIDTGTLWWEDDNGSFTLSRP